MERDRREGKGEGEKTKRDGEGGRESGGERVKDWSDSLERARGMGEGSNVGAQLPQPPSGRVRNQHHRMRKQRGV